MKSDRSCVLTPSTPREVKELLHQPAQGGEDAPEEQDDSRYVDFAFADVSSGGERSPKDPRTGDRHHMSVNSSGTGGLCATETKQKLVIKSEAGIKRIDAAGTRTCAEDFKKDPPVASSSSAPQCLNVKSEESLKSGDPDQSERAITEPDAAKEKKHNSKGDVLHCHDNDLSGRSKSDDYEDDEDDDDDVSLVFSDDSVPCVTEDESHYITTHEIQLSEISDDERDDELGLASSTSWDLEDGSQVFSFVDYASFACGDAAVGERGDGVPSTRGAAAVSTLPESDPRVAASFSSDESLSVPQQQCGNSAGQIHLSIRTTSRSINDPSNIQEKENRTHPDRLSGDMRRYVLRGVHGNTDTLCDRAKCFIAAPGRVHFGGRLRGQEVTGESSGESSAVSELDDADKEVRNLTARAFKSLAYPYLGAINFSTSSESSASEHGIGINSWSTFVDLKYGKMNMSRGLNQSVVSHQNSTASFEIAKNIDNRGYKGICLASSNPPTSQIYSLNGNPHRASSSTKKVELMGKFGQGHSGLIRLTETLNFRCNVKSGMSLGERRTNFAQNSAGSRSTDEVTNSLSSGQSREDSKPPSKTMEDTHKKAIFASSLIKNVISKKMQFEQERKMERGEICEPLQTPSLCIVHQESDGQGGKGCRELHRQSSRFSESSSDYNIMCVDELGELVDSGSCDAKSESREQDAATLVPGTNSGQTNEAGINTKKGALEASKSTLLRSQNSAFRCWKDEELELLKDHQYDQSSGEKSLCADDRDVEGDQYPVGDNKLTKMSHLFVPSIQLLSSDGEVGQQLSSRTYSPCGGGRGIQLRYDTLYIADSRTCATSKSPEIKINLRSVGDNRTEPFGVSKLRAPNIGSSSRTDDFKRQALAAALRGESSDKVPHFMVRDIRDNKAKLQTPIHQVRDVRKLVKSSYHFVALDNNDNKSNFTAADNCPEIKKKVPYRTPTSVSPIVIKCQSVNTNSNGKQSGNPELSKRESLDVDRSSPEGAKCAAVQRLAGKEPITMSVNSSDEAGLSRMASKRQEKISDITDKKSDSKIGNQMAFEKLQAAVKTMEELYVFEKNEWKRKDEPHGLVDSHVLSLITSDEQLSPEEEGPRGSNMDKPVRRDSYPNTSRTPPAVVAPPFNDSPLRREDKGPNKGFQTFGGPDDRCGVKLMQAGCTRGSQNMFSHKGHATINSKTHQANTATQTPFNTKNFTPESAKLPMSLKINRTRWSGNERAEPKDLDGPLQNLVGTAADHENYLTIPVKSQASSRKQASSLDKTSVYTFPSQSHQTTPPGHLGYGGGGQEEHNQSPRRSSIVMEARSPDIPSATIYHSLPLGMSPSQPQVYCFSPAVTPAPPLDPFQTTQRKMLLDPTTGNYYLVDTPVQPATKRLFDPETGQYVDVPMQQPPMTPVPMPMSPLAFSPGAYGHTYMIYPSYLPTPSVIPPRTLVQSQMSVQSEVESGEKAASLQSEGLYMESPFYMTTGKSPQVAPGTPNQAPTNRLPQGFSSAKQPVISITSQQGPRIIAPPSFDGNTMSFVVEHR